MTNKVEYRIIDIERLRGDLENTHMKLRVLESRIEWIEKELIKLK